MSIEVRNGVAGCKRDICVAFYMKKNSNWERKKRETEREISERDGVGKE